MNDDFDVGAAVDDIGSGLGLGSDESDDDLELEVKTPAEEKSPADPSTEDSPTEAPEAAPPLSPESSELAPPKTWRKEATAAWAALPSEIKNEVLKREADIFRGIESYKADAALGKTYKGVMAPYEQVLQQHRIDPVQQVGNLMKAHYMLATATPEARVQMFQKLAADYGVDLSTLAGGEAPYIDPSVRLLQTELAGVKSQLSAAERSRQAEIASANAKQVDAFASDTKNVYFNEVAEQMATLLSKGISGTLQEAYDKAVWLNPTTRAKEVARQSAEAAKSAAAASTAKLAAAKRATAANVRTSAKSGSATTPLGSIDDTLNEAFAAIKARG